MSVIRAVLRLLKRAYVAVRLALGLTDSEARLAAQAQRYWQRDTPRVGSNAHLRGAGPITDEVWTAIGQRHVELCRRFAAAIGAAWPPRSVVDWGCGGGATAAALSPEVEVVYGVDVAPRPLQESAAQVRSAGGARFVAVPIEVGDPEAALDVIPDGVDLFFCSYVFELIPSRAHGRQILSIAARLLAPGGMAVIQVKYDTGELRTRSRPFAYAANLASNTTYRIEEFWAEAQAAGLVPQMMTLVPEDDLTGDERYAYVLLTAAT